MLRSLCLAALLAVLLLAAPASADTSVVVGFDTGPALDTPITTEYLQSSFVSFQKSDAPRPYRRAAPGQARSGTVVANIGADLCQLEVDDAIDCEFPIGGTAGRLIRTARSIRLYAGLFQATQQPVTVQLLAYRADGSVAATGTAQPVTAAGFSKEVSVASAAADIARFIVRVDGNGAIGARVGFDDLTLVYPDSALPDVALSVPPGEVAVPQGGSVDVPVTVTRLNGSAGPLTFSATGLPLGVTATFTGSTLRLRAAANAPRTPLDVARDSTIVADPRGDGAVAPGTRTTKLPLRVSSPFELVGPATAGIPPCGVTELALRLERDRAFAGTVRLEAKNLPAGVTATYEPGPEIPPGGGRHVEIKLRLSAAERFAATPVTVEATAPDVTRSLILAAEPAPATATVRFPAGKLIAPRQLRPGNQVVLEGSGFCADTSVAVGNSAALAPAVVEDGGRTLRFTTPRLATSGPLTIVSPHAPQYAASAPVEVDTFRSNKALPFENYPYGGFSFEEAEAVFGADELLTRVNPCWPFGNCTVTLPVPDPTALVVVPVIDQLLQSTGGHCFGIARAEQGWAHAPASLKRWTAAGSAFSIARTNGVSSYLDGQHALQASSEYIAAWVARKRSITHQLAVVRDQLAKGELPMVSVSEDRSGHAVLAYDIVDHPDGRADVLVADSNLPFLSDELTSGFLHLDRETRASVIRIAADRKSWELDMSSKTWRGGDNTIFAAARGVIPGNPTLPGLSITKNPAAFILFGSADGAVRTEATDDYLPPQDAAATPGAGGAVRGTSHTLRGVKAGRYRQAVIGGETVATVAATTAADAKDTLRLDGRKLVYGHDGKAVTFSFSLSTPVAGGGTAVFKSEPLRVAPGDTLTAEPKGDRVRLSVRERGGKVRTRELRNRLKPAATLAVTRLSVRDGKARATVRIGGLKGDAGGAVVLRATRNGKTVSRKLFTLAKPRNGSRTFTWRLPTRDVRLSVHATLAAGGTTLRRTRVA